MKTQETVLKQRISHGLITGFIFLWSQAAFGFTSQAPWVNQVGLEQGFSLGATTQVQSGESSATDYSLNLSGAIGDETSLFGQASLQYDQRIGAVKTFALNSWQNVYLQTEGSFDSSHAWGLDIGGFDRISFSQLSLPHVALELGAGIQYRPASELATLLFSLGLLHADRGVGFRYGIFLRGEGATAAPVDENRISLAAQPEVSFTTEELLRYVVTASVPLSPESARNTLSLRFGLSYAFGENHEPTSLPTRKEMIPDATENLHYNLKAKVVSMNEALFLIKIDKGSSDSIVKGQSFDIYSGETLMARAQAVSVKLDEAALNVIEYKQEQWIELGFIARRIGE